MISPDTRMMFELSRVVDGQTDAHIWLNSYGIPVYAYFGPVDEKIPADKLPVDGSLEYQGRLPKERALESLIAFAQLEISTRGDS